jgi:hypothetical protein
LYQQRIDFLTIWFFRRIAHHFASLQALLKIRRKKCKSSAWAFYFYQNEENINIVQAFYKTEMTGFKTPNKSKTNPLYI